MLCQIRALGINIIPKVLEKDPKNRHEKTERKSNTSQSIRLKAQVDIIYWDKL